MKKLMIALGAVACAISLQAASGSWASGLVAFNGQSDEDLNGYIYNWAIVEATQAQYEAGAFDAIKFDGTSVSGLAEGMKVTEFTETGLKYVGDGLTGSLTGTAGNYYALIINQADQKLWGISDAKVAITDPTVEGGSALRDMDFANGSMWGETGVMIANQAYSSVPEPTSGLLLLLGVAGLALRRRRA